MPDEVNEETADNHGKSRRISRVEVVGGGIEPPVSRFLERNRALSQTEGEDLLGKSGRGEWIRTTDPSVPNRVLYQAEPRPDTKA